MANVKFNVDVVDSDSQVRYVASDEFVEVSDAFAKRLTAHAAHGDSFEVEGYEAPDTEMEAVRAEFISLIGEKPGRKGIDTMKAEIEAFKQANQ